MDLFQLLESRIDVPLIAAVVFIFLQIVKQTKFPNKLLPVASFFLGAGAGIIKLGMAGTLSFETSIGIYSIIASSFLYGAGAIAVWALLKQTTAGKAIDQIFTNMYTKATGKTSYADESNPVEPKTGDK